MKSDYPGKGRVSLAFPTPVYRHVWPGADAVNAGLRRIILEKEKNQPSLGRSNVGGWHSSEDLIDWPHPEIKALRGWVGQAVAEMTSFAIEDRGDRPFEVEVDGGAWVNLSRDGGYNKIHNHPECHWSGVYYVCVGDRDPNASEGAGKIEFLDPRMAATVVTPDGPDAPPKLIIDPVPGLMVVFPNWLYHYVNPFHGSGVRISIAFNVRLRFRSL